MAWLQHSQSPLLIPALLLSASSWLTKRQYMQRRRVQAATLTHPPLTRLPTAEITFRFSDINDLLDICSPSPEEWTNSKRREGVCVE